MVFVSLNTAVCPKRPGLFVGIVLVSIPFQTAPAQVGLPPRGRARVDLRRGHCGALGVPAQLAEQICVVGFVQKSSS